MFENGIMLATAGAEGAFIGHNILLAEQALGLGGWLYGGMTSFVVMGGTPEFRIVFELTNERPQKSTVPQTARRGNVLDMIAYAARNAACPATYSSVSFLSFGEITIRQ